MDEMTFTTPSGRELTLRPVGRRYVQQILSKPEMPKKPTYEAVTVSGHVEIHEHDEKSLETDEEKAAWLDYQTAQKEVVDERLANLTMFLFIEGVVDDPPPLDEWSVDLKRWDLEVPDDPEELKSFWLENEVCPGESMGRLMARLFQVAGLADEEGAAQLESLFRLTLARLTLS